VLRVPKYVPEDQFPSGAACRGSPERTSNRELDPLLARSREADVLSSELSLVEFDAEALGRSVVAFWGWSSAWNARMMG